MEKYYTTYLTTNSLVCLLRVDPLADKHPGWSPYNYCVNNPLRFVDPTGMEWVESSTATGGYMWNEDVHNQDDADKTNGKGKTRYKGRSFTHTDKKYGKRKYNDDGSIYFYQQGLGYLFMWDRSNANNHENFALISISGVLVVDDSKADETTHKVPDIKGLSVKHNLRTIATVHTHLHPLAYASLEDRDQAKKMQMPFYVLCPLRVYIQLPFANGPRDYWMQSGPGTATNFIPSFTAIKLIEYTENKMWEWVK